MSRSGCALSLVRQRQLKIGGGGFVKKISVMASATMMTLGCMTQAVAQQEAVPAADGQQQAAPNSSAPPPAQPADQAPYATIPVPTKAPPPVATTPSNNSRKIDRKSTRLNSS